MTDKKRWTHPNKWAEIFEIEDDIKICGATIRRRLKKKENELNEVKDVRTKSGHILQFYLESDVRKACVDLLKNEEEVIEEAKRILNVYGISDKQSLMRFGPTKFKSTIFAPFGKGKSFAIAILGENIDSQIDTIVLECIAAKLNFPQLSEENKKKYIEALATYNITDRQSLLNFGTVQFRTTVFFDDMKGCAFAGAILGEVVEAISINILERIDDVLNLPGFSEESRQKYIQILAIHGITDKQSLLNFGTVQFRTTSFFDDKNGKTFSSEILGKTITKITISVLEQIADKLNLPQLSEENKKKYIEALATYNITDRQSLLNFGTVQFRTTSFFDDKKGIAFSSEILGKTITKITISVLEQIADKLGWN